MWRTATDIEIRTQRAWIEIQSPKPKLNIRQKNARLQVHRRPPRFTINREFRSSGSGSLNHLGFVWERSLKSRHFSLGAVSLAASKKAGAIGMEGKERFTPEPLIRYPKDIVDISSRFIPNHTIVWDPGDLEIEWSKPELEIEWKVESRPKIIVHPHRVEVHVKKRHHKELPTMKHHPIYRSQTDKKGTKIDKKV